MVWNSILSKMILARREIVVVWNELTTSVLTYIMTKKFLSISPSYRDYLKQLASRGKYFATLMIETSIFLIYARAIHYTNGGISFLISYSSWDLLNQLASRKTDSATLRLETTILLIYALAIHYAYDGVSFSIVNICYDLYCNFLSYIYAAHVTLLGPVRFYISWRSNLTTNWVILVKVTEYPT